MQLNKNSEETLAQLKSLFENEKSRLESKLKEEKSKNEKNSSNSLNFNNNKKYNTNSNSNLLKKTGGSSNELFRNNLIKKSKTNSISNQIGYILTTTGNSNSQSKTSFLSPQNLPGQKIIFLKNDKNKIKEAKEKSRKNSTSSTNKDQKK